jgi:ribosomal protein S18 acetylase RimI-like enzyme
MLTFRRGTPQDVPALIPMVVEQYALHQQWDPEKFTPRPGFETGYSRWLADRAQDPRSVLYVAEAEPASVVGFIVATIESEIPIYLNRHYGFIHELYVLPDYRNEGAARQLVLLAVESLRSLGVDQVRCETASKNGPARNLFLRCGFRESTVTYLFTAPTAPGSSASPR